MKAKYYESREKIVLENIHGKVLDIGYVGWEKFHEDMRKGVGCDVYGIDIEVRKIENAIKASGDNLPFKEETFDFIIAGEIIEHVSEPFKFLNDCKRVLKKGGEIIITTPNIHALYWFIRHSLGKAGISIHYQHIYAWDLLLLERLVTKAGLKVKENGYINICEKKKIPHYIIYRLRKQLSWHIYIIAVKI